MMVEVSAPSNIALIKYMGKLDGTENRPTNSSLSWTLDELRSFVRITPLENAPADQWKALQRPDLHPIALSESSIERYLKHFNFLKREWNVEGFFLVESANNFPSDCGLASSASSFAALTMAAVELFQKRSPRENLSKEQMAIWSRRGSGSSCRSFFGPFAQWDREGIRAVNFPYLNLLHQVVVVTGQRKLVSSSEAHRRVVTSLQFRGRPERAEQRLSDLLTALKMQNWRSAYDLSWAEFWDMHSLFESSMPAFGYLTPASLEVLELAQSYWDVKPRGYEDGPVITMDAGANVHLLWHSKQIHLAKKLTLELSQRHRVYSCQSIQEALRDPSIITPD